MANLDNVSPERRKALADIIGNEAEAILIRAERTRLEADALHRAAERLFAEADRLDPIGLRDADNDDRKPQKGAA